MYPYERFTQRARSVLSLAQGEAERAHHSYIGTEHLLLGLLRGEEGVAARVLTSLGVEIAAVREAIDALLGRNEGMVVDQLIPNSRVKSVIETAFEEARRMGNHHVGTEHLLLGLLLEGEGIAAHVLKDLGANLEAVRAEIGRQLVAGGPEETSGAGSETPGGVSRLIQSTGMTARMTRRSGPEELLLWIASRQGSLAATILAERGLDRVALEAELRARGWEPGAQPEPPGR